MFSSNIDAEHSEAYLLSFADEVATYIGLDA
jgi:hypothetical protein